MPPKNSMDSVKLQDKKINIKKIAFLYINNKISEKGRFKFHH